MALLLTIEWLGRCALQSTARCPGVAFARMADAAEPEEGLGETLNYTTLLQALKTGLSTINPAEN